MDNLLEELMRRADPNGPWGCDIAKRAIAEIERLRSLADQIEMLLTDLKWAEEKHGRLVADLQFALAENCRLRMALEEIKRLYLDTGDMSPERVIKIIEGALHGE